MKQSLPAMYACVIGLGLAWPSSTTAADERTDFFEKKIRPVLVAKCYSCHSADAAKKRRLKGGLQLDTRAGIRAGGENGPAVVPGNVKKSLIVDALRHETFKMPPNAKLPKPVIADVIKWIQLGAADPRDGKPVPTTGPIDYVEGRKHWAYQPLNPGRPPTVKNQAWPTGKIDRYVLARIEAAKLVPAADATPLAVLRRLCFDLTGLPPTIEQVKRFEKLSADDAAKAYTSLVDDLLKSRRFGEHWARHWLDGIRYNPQLETSAFYRNWVIDAFNADMPYNEFLQKQLAGDLLPTDGKQASAGNLIATQMLAYNRKEADFVEASLEVIGQQMLGISFNCAKCHDHKYDAVSQEDYYGLAGILTSSRVPKSARDGVTLPGSKTRVVTLVEEKPKKIGPTHLLLGGDKSRRGKRVPRRLPKVFFEKEPPRVVSRSTSGRLELARWIGDGKNPLTARVMANRIWQRLVGRGIVTTPNDFGTNGDAPTHPRLLDYLASRLIESGWSIKAVIREVVRSRTYRQSVVPTKESHKRDHTNALYTRAIPKRLQFEQVMDQLLTVAGRLKLGVVEPVAKINKWPKHRQRDKSYGGPRTIYVRPDEHAQRTFDGPDPELLVVERARSVTAPQSLLFLNGDMVRELSAVTAKRIQLLDKSNGSTEIQNSYRLLFSRLPSDAEQTLGRKFIAKYGFARYIHTLICTNEFLHLN